MLVEVEQEYQQQLQGAHLRMQEVVVDLHQDLNQVVLVEQVEPVVEIILVVMVQLTEVVVVVDLDKMDLLEMVETVVQV